MESIKHSSGIAAKKVKASRKVAPDYSPRVAQPGKAAQPAKVTKAAKSTQLAKRTKAAKAAPPAKTTKPNKISRSPEKQEKDKKPIGKYKAFRQKGRSR